MSPPPERAISQPTPAAMPNAGEDHEHELPTESRFGLGHLADEVPGVERQRADDQHGDGERRQRPGGEHDPGEPVAEAPAAARLQHQRRSVSEW